MPIPTWIEVKASPELIGEIIRHFKKHHSGKDRAATKKEIIRELFEIGPEDKRYENISRIFRRCIEIAINDHQALIVSSTDRGYWWSTSQDDLDDIERALARAFTLMQTNRTLRENLVGTFGQQTRMKL